MARLIKLEANKTYKTRENAVAAVEKKIKPDQLTTLRYIITSDDDGRFFPVFIGEVAMQSGIHFHFNVIA